MNSVVFSLETFFKEYYGMEKIEFINIAQNIEIEMYNNCKKDLLKKLLDLHYTAFDIFRKNFWYDEGLPRVWNKIDENLIKELKTKFINENEFIFKLFNQFKLLRNPLNRKLIIKIFFARTLNFLKFIFIIKINLDMNYIKPEEEGISEFIKEIPEIIKKEEKFNDLLSISEIGDLKFRYMEKVEELFEDAMRRHVIILFFYYFFRIILCNNLCLYGFG